jgi:hypothetical protein
MSEEKREIYSGDAPSSPGAQSAGDRGVLTGEKPTLYAQETEITDLERTIEQQLNVTEDDLLEAKSVAATMTLEGTRQVINTTFGVLFTSAFTYYVFSDDDDCPQDP